MSSPKVSIIITTYNRSSLLSRAIKSVYLQTYSDWELILWDDGSNDDTKLVVDSLFDSRVQYVYSENHGKSYALNQALKLVKGEYIAFLDDDDQWLSDKLAVQITIMEKFPEVEVLFSDYNNINTYLAKIGKCFEDHKDVLGKLKTKEIASSTYLVLTGIPEQLLRANIVLPSAVMMKRACYHKNGNYNENLKNAEDLEYWWRLGLSKTQFAFTNQILVNRFKQPDSLSRENSNTYLNHIKALGICLDLTLKNQRLDLLPYIRQAYFNSWKQLFRLYFFDRKWKEAFKAIIQTLNYV